MMLSLRSLVVLGCLAVVGRAQSARAHPFPAPPSPPEPAAVVEVEPEAPAVVGRSAWPVAPAPALPPQGEGDAVGDLRRAVSRLRRAELSPSARRDAARELRRLADLLGAGQPLARTRVAEEPDDVEAEDERVREHLHQLHAELHAGAIEPDEPDEPGEPDVAVVPHDHGFFGAMAEADRARNEARAALARADFERARRSLRQGNVLFGAVPDAPSPAIAGTPPPAPPRAVRAPQPPPVGLPQRFPAAEPESVDELRAMVDGLRAEMAEVRALLGEIRARAGSRAARGDR